MKSTLLSAALVLIGLSAAAQITFEKGHFIASDGQRTECEIRNVDWNSNPTSFQYRVGGGEPKDATIESVAEFGISGGSTFRRFTVDIDRSSDDISRLTKNRNPEFKSEILYLRLLVEGKANLYEYADQGLKRYFYQVDNGTAMQLVYKRYLQSSERGWETGKAAANEQYKQQLFNDLKCSAISQKDVESLKYERGPLMKFFGRYNECKGSVVKTNESIKRKAETHLSLRPGIAYNGFEFGTSSQKDQLEKAVAFRLGLEVETVLPFNKGLWSVVFEPAYQSYSSKNTSGSIKLDYKSIDVAIGVRRYLFIKETGSLYLNAGFVYAIPLAADDALKVSSVPFKVSTGVNFTAGVGYRINKFSAELFYGFGRGLTGDYLYYSSSYGGPGLILGYRLK